MKIDVMTYKEANGYDFLVIYTNFTIQITYKNKVYAILA